MDLNLRESMTIFNSYHADGPTQDGSMFRRIQQNINFLKAQIVSMRLVLLRKRDLDEEVISIEVLSVASLQAILAFKQAMVVSSTLQSKYNNC